MYVALGFLAASLLGFAVAPALYKRAVRLTKEAMNAVNPSTYAEVQAAQDAERARNAISLNKVEQALQAQREETASHRLETARLKSEIVRMRAGHAMELSSLRQELEADLAEKAGSAAQTYRRDLKRTKSKLEKTEELLEKAHLKLEERKQAGQPVLFHGSEGDDSLAPTAATMELAAVAALESEVAQLKTKLAAYEAGSAETSVVPLEADAAALKDVVVTLESELIEAETKYIAAQAEVARLLVQLDTTGLDRTAAAAQLRTNLKAADAEASNLKAQLSNKDRMLGRARAQIARLRKDLEMAPELSSLRSDLRSLTKQFSKKRDTSKPQGETGATIKSPVENDVAPTATTSDKSNPTKKKKPTQSPTKTHRRSKGEKPQADTSHTGMPKEKLSPARALMKKIVASQKTPATSVRDDDSSNGLKKIETSPTTTKSKSARSKDKKRDVA